MSTETSTTLLEHIDAWVRDARAPDGDVWLDDVLMSADEWLAIEDYEWSHVELIEGRIRMPPPPSDFHQDSAMCLGSMLNVHVRSNKLGKVFMAPMDIFVAGSVCQPDIMWFPKGHPRIAKPDQKNRTPPAMVVEILSPSNFRFDLGRKRELYAKAGIAHYWIVDPMRKDIEAFELRDGVYVDVGEYQKETFHAPPFADLQIDLAEIFPWK